MKVYELARELKMESKSLLAKLKLWGIHAPSHMATLDERTVNIVRQKVKKGEEAPEAPKKPILIKKKSASPGSESPESPTIQTEAPFTPEAPSEPESTVVMEKVTKPAEAAPPVAEGHPVATSPAENILPRIPVEGWTQENAPARQTEKASSPPSAAVLSKDAAEKGVSRDRSLPGDKRGKPAKTSKEKNQKLDRLHMLREEDFVDLDETGEKESPAAKPAVSPAPAHRVVAPGAPPESQPSARTAFPRPAFKKPSSFKKKGKGGSDSRGAAPAVDGTKARKKSIRIEAGTSVKDFADKIGVKV